MEKGHYPVALLNRNDWVHVVINTMCERNLVTEKKDMNILNQSWILVFYKIQMFLSTKTISAEKNSSRRKYTQTRLKEAELLYTKNVTFPNRSDFELLSAKCKVTQQISSRDEKVENSPKVLFSQWNVGRLKYSEGRKRERLSVNQKITVEIELYKLQKMCKTGLHNTIWCYWNY